ncbi:MAG: GGDEF domain-containing protein [Sphingomonadaceae bacterium]|nr:GGDEF domain-containing protein [Sphingomonadaceae bacterium]
MSKEFDVPPTLVKPTFLARIFGRNGDGPHKPHLRRTLSREDRFMLRHAALIEQLFDFLAHSGLDPIPDHYELAWHYLTCASASQRAMVETCMLEHGGIDPAQAADLLDRIRTAISERELQSMVDDAREKMNEAAALTDRSGRQVAEFGDALGESAAVFIKGGGSDADQAAQIRKLQNLTAEMIERAAQAEGQLKARSKAISQLRSRLAQTQKQALSDPLTNLPNRRAFEACLKGAIDNADHSGQPLSVAFCDIDFFKRINDTHGHATGDRVIHHVAEILNKASSAKVHVARHGGEEFALVFEQMSASGSVATIDQIRLRMSAKRLVAKDTMLPIGEVTLSAGVAQLHSGESSTALLARADQALYEAKNSGRDRVCVAI